MLASTVTSLLLQLFDKIQPGIVNWDKVNSEESLKKKIGGNMKKLENCNYAIDIAHQLRFSLVGVAGKDIFDGTKVLTLGKYLLLLCIEVTNIIIVSLYAVIFYPNNSIAI